MAFLVKRNTRQSSSGASQGGLATLSQFIQVTTAARSLPATTTDQIFRVRGGRVLVHAILGQVTTVIQAQACNLKISSKALDTASAAVGTAVDIAANADINGKEVGSFALAKGDGSALSLTNAGGSASAELGGLILPQGEIYLTTSATNTGAYKWDIFYQPLDAGAFVESVVTAAVAI